VTLLVVGSVKGAPGATTAALGLAACWPGQPVLLVEADPHGGDLAARFGRAETPGLATAAAQARHGTEADWPSAHAQSLPVGCPVLLGPAAGHAATAAVTALAAHTPALRHRSAPTLIDAGRLSASAATTAMVDAADVVLFVVRPRLDHLAHLHASLSLLSDHVRPRAQVVLAGAGPYTAAEVHRELRVSVAAVLPHDRRGAGVLSGRFAPTIGWRRLRLPRALHRLAGGLATASVTPSVSPAAPTREGA